MRQRISPWAWFSLAAAAVAAVGLAGLAAADAGGLRLGGEAEAHVPLHPALGTDGWLRLFAGLGPMELASRTDLSLLPYTLANETLSLALAQDWLSVSAEYATSVLPLGITAAALVVRAYPPHAVQDDGTRRTELWVEGEARQKGSSWARFPDRTEVWVKGSAVFTLLTGFPDEITLGASATATASDPHGEVIWWTGSLLLGARLWGASLEAETDVSIAPARVEAQRLTLTSATCPCGISAYARVSLSEPDFLPVLEVGASLQFGDPSLEVPSQGSCSGGVCTGW